MGVLGSSECGRGRMRPAGPRGQVSSIAITQTTTLSCEDSGWRASETIAVAIRIVGSAAADGGPVPPASRRLSQKVNRAARGHRKADGRRDAGGTGELFRRLGSLRFKGLCGARPSWPHGAARGCGLEAHGPGTAGSAAILAAQRRASMRAGSPRSNGLPGARPSWPHGVARGCGLEARAPTAIPERAILAARRRASMRAESSRSKRRLKSPRLIRLTNSRGISRMSRWL